VAAKERLIARSENEHILEAVQERLDANPQAMRQGRETAEHPFGTIKARMGATHFQMRTLPKVTTEMALAAPGRRARHRGARRRTGAGLCRHVAGGKGVQAAAVTGGNGGGRY
jgi:hypothetical protein